MKYLNTYVIFNSSIINIFNQAFSMYDIFSITQPSNGCMMQLKHACRYLFVALNSSDTGRQEDW